MAKIREDTPCMTNVQNKTDCSRLRVFFAKRAGEESLSVFLPDYRRGVFIDEDSPMLHCLDLRTRKSNLCSSGTNLNLPNKKRQPGYRDCLCIFSFEATQWFRSFESTNPSTPRLRSGSNPEHRPELACGELVESVEGHVEGFDSSCEQRSLSSG